MPPLEQKYKILKIIGEGAFSTIYMGLDRNTNRKVAIKTTKSNSKENKILEVLKSIETEHIVNIYDIIGDDSVCYLIFELCDNNLIDFINSCDCSERNICNIIRMILVGLSHLHNKGIIHRDIKMSNILIRENTIKICDFGLSCFMDDYDKNICGTVDYLAPELKNGGDIRYTTAVDIYAVGIIAKNLICKNKNGNLDNVEISEELRMFIKQMLVDNPNKRPTAVDLLKNNVFDQFFIKMPNFKAIKEFTRETKYGTLIRKNNSISINYGNILEVCYYECCHTENKCNYFYDQQSIQFCDNFNTYIKYNGNIIDIKLMDNKNVQYHNYLCKYIEILANKTIIHSIKSHGYEFNYFLDKHWQYKTQEIDIIKNNSGYEINGKQHNTFPLELNNLMKYIEILIERSKKYVIKCKSEYSLEETSQFDLSIKNENKNTQLFIKDIGWMYKQNDTKIILLNNGMKIEVNKEYFVMDDKIIFYNQTDKSHSTLLKIIDMFDKQ